MTTTTVFFLLALFATAQAWSSLGLHATFSRIHLPSPTTSRLFSAPADDNDGESLMTAGDSTAHAKSIATESWSASDILSQQDFFSLLEDSLVTFGSTASKKLISEILQMRQSSNDLQSVNGLLDALLEKPDGQKYPFWARIRKLSRFSKRARLVSLRRTLDAVVEQQSSTSTTATSRRRALLTVLSALSAEQSTVASMAKVRGSAIATLEKWVQRGHSVSDLVPTDLEQTSDVGESVSATTNMNDRGETIAQKKLMKTVADAISVDETKLAPADWPVEEEEAQVSEIATVGDTSKQTETEPESSEGQGETSTIVDGMKLEAESILKERETKQSQAEAIVKHAKRQSEAGSLLQERETKQAQADTIIKNAKMKSEAEATLKERESKQALASEMSTNAKRKSEAENMQLERQAKQSEAMKVIKTAKMKANAAEIQSARQLKQAQASEMVMKSKASAVKVEREQTQANAAEIAASQTSETKVVDIVEPTKNKNLESEAVSQVEKEAEPTEVVDLLENVLQDVWSMEEKAKPKKDGKNPVELPNPISKSQVQPAKRNKQVRHSRKNLEIMAKKLEEKSQTTDMTLEDKTYQVLKDLGLI